MTNRNLITITVGPANHASRVLFDALTIIMQRQGIRIWEANERLLQITVDLDEADETRLYEEYLA